MNRVPAVDPLTLSIIEGRLESLNEELAVRTGRQCFSQPTSHLHDLGTVLFDKQERSITIGDSMPVHTAGAHIALGGILDWIGRDNIHPDDFIIGNDPFIIRFGHLPDWSFVRPIFYEGELLFYHYMRTHQYDTGGAFPGCYFPRTYDCHGEGLLIPPTKIIEQGKIDEKAYGVILNNVRGGAMVRADNMLIYMSMKKCEERIADLLHKYGKDTVLAVCDELLRKGEEMGRKLISRWPAGTYRAERAADWDGTTDEPVWVRLALTVKPDEGKLIFDFSESDKQVDMVNVPIGQVWSSVVSGLIWSMPPNTLRNQGLFDLIDIIAPEGSVLNPVYPATTGAQACFLGIQVTECVFLALSQIIPEDTSALWGRHINPLFVGKRRDRVDPRTKTFMTYMSHPFHATPSNGAIYGFDGTDGMGATNLGGAELRSPIEVEEWEIPYRWKRFEFRQDSAGAGRWRGGLGTHVETQNVYDRKLWQPLDCVTMSGNSDGEKFGALGLMGGTEGKTHQLWIIRGNEKLPYRCNDVKYLEPGDTVVSNSGGGGGVGDPLDREVEMVRRDAMDEYISMDTARNIYGVVMDPKTFKVDEAATGDLRKKLKAQKKG